MAITPSQPDVSSDHSKSGTKKRRRSQLHHQIAWWVPNETTTEIGPDGEHSNSTMLSGGENWLVWTSSATETAQPYIVDNDLHKFTGATTGNPFPIDEILDMSNPKLADDAEESLAGEDAKTSNRDGFALLCIDVDEKGKYVAVKDVRLIDPPVARQHQSSRNGDSMMDDGIAQAADSIEFFHARRKIYNELPVSNNGLKSNGVIVQNVDNKQRVDVNNCSSGESTSGYGSDDEKDWNDDAEELNDHNQVRFHDGLSPPPRESDQDNKGRALYHHPEPLPRRQLRVLHHGDRILLRFKTTKGEESDDNKLSVMKFEYFYGYQHHSSNHSSKKRRDCHDVKNMSMPQATNGQRKPRLLSVKSADVKSTEKKRFTLNSTSAADAPTAEEQDYGRSRKMTSYAEAGHKAGKDWSALETENDDGPKIEAGKDNEGKDAADGGGDDDDGCMEEYSYLTGEVVIKDQDYISAITGDEATNAARHPEAAGIASDDAKSGTSGGEDAATASAVILGAVTSPPKQTCEDALQKGSSDPKRVTLGTTTREESEEKEDVPMPNGENGQNGPLFEEEDVGKAENENSQNTALFFTAPDHDESDDDNMSGEDLLSPAKPPKNKEGTIQHAVHFDSEMIAAAAAVKDDNEDDGSVTDYSLTQPFPVPRNVTEQKRSSSSDEEEKEVDDDDDESTVCPEVDDMDDEKVKDSKPPPMNSKDEDMYDEPTQPIQFPRKPHEPLKQSDDDDAYQEGVDDYDEPTQPIQYPRKPHEPFDQSDDDDAYQADTQFDLFTSSKNAPVQLNDNESKPNDAHDDENQKHPGPITEAKVETLEPKIKATEAPPIDDAESVCKAVKYEGSDRSATKKQPPTKYPKKNNVGKEIGKETVIEMERLDNSAVHRIQSGAIMTGPVGGAVAFASPSTPHLDVPNSLVKTAAMLQSIDPKTHPLPDNTEETVCQIDDAIDKYEADESGDAPASNTKYGHRQKRATRTTDIGARDPNIPTEVCITGIDRGRETTPRHRASRNRSTPTSGRRKESKETVRVMFTGLSPTKKHKQVRNHFFCAYFFVHFFILTTTTPILFLSTDD